MQKKLVRNAIKCNHCNTIIESNHIHDRVECMCKKVFVTGGLDYVKVGCTKSSDYESLAEYTAPLEEQLKCLAKIMKARKDTGLNESN